MVCRWAARSLKAACGYDDVLDAFALHGVGGVVGSLLAAAFSHQSLGGSLSGAMSTQALVQLFCCCIVAAWALVGTFVVGKVVAVLCGGLRVSQEAEEYGTDLVLAEPDAYSAE